MKYWLLTSEYPPFYGGGISTYCYQTSKMLTAKGHAVTVFINDPTVSDFVCQESDNIRVIRFNPTRTKSADSLGYVAANSYGFADIIKHFILIEGKPDVIEAQEYLGIAYYLLQFKYLQYDWCKNVPVLITMHSPSFLYLEYNQVPMFKYPNYFIGEMERFCIRAADMLISPSKYLERDVQKRFSFEHASLHILANPFDANSIIETSSNNPPADIIFFGKLSAQKGVFKLLNYFKKLWDDGFTESLYLVGGQDIVYHPENKQMGDVIKAGYKQYIESNLLILEPKVAPADISKRVSNAKVIIIPSIVDNLPYVVLEMMAMGKIVLASKQGGQAEIVDDGINGFLFDHDDPRSFFTALNKILNLNQQDRNTISQQAKNKISTVYAHEKIYEHKIKLIEEALMKSIGYDVFPFIRSNSKNDLHVTNKLNQKDNFLSIVIPFYNMGDYIDETIESLLAVEKTDFEIIIVNDGSTDTLSLEKLRKYRNGEGVRVIDSENKGLASARNIGAENADGEFLSFLDADDKVSKDYYAKAIQVLKKYKNVFFVGAWTKYFDSSDKTWPTFIPEPPMILVHNLVNTSSLIYKKQAFLNAGINDGDMPFKGLEDYESLLSMISKSYNGIVLPEVHFHYRVRDDSMIRSISKIKKMLLFQYISEKHKDFYAVYATEIFNLINANGPGFPIDNPSLDFQFAGSEILNHKLAKKIISIIKSNKLTKKAALKIYNFLN